MKIQASYRIEAMNLADDNTATATLADANMALQKWSKNMKVLQSHEDQVLLAFERPKRVIVLMLVKGNLETITDSAGKSRDLRKICKPLIYLHLNTLINNKALLVCQTWVTSELATNHGYIQGMYTAAHLYAKQNRKDLRPGLVLTPHTLSIWLSLYAKIPAITVGISEIFKDDTYQYHYPVKRTDIKAKDKNVFYKDRPLIGDPNLNIHFVWPK